MQVANIFLLLGIKDSYIEFPVWFKIVWLNITFLNKQIENK